MEGNYQRKLSRSSKRSKRTVIIIIKIVPLFILNTIIAF